jgi:diaminobutyrate-2-oxoglutarate transaminase
MLAVELIDGPSAEAVQQRCLAAGVIVLNCGPHGEVLRLVPPLTITDDELELGLTTLLAALG